MTFVLAICVAACFGVALYLLLGRDLKGVAMGVFLIGHAANLSIIAMSGSPVVQAAPPQNLKGSTIASYSTPKTDALGHMVDPLPQALILTAIVIGFAVMGFLLTLLVVTARSAKTLELTELAKAPAAARANPASGPDDRAERGSGV